MSTPGNCTQLLIVEAGPRDGLQNEKQIVSANTKLELIDRLAVAPGAAEVAVFAAAYPLAARLRMGLQIDGVRLD